MTVKIEAALTQAKEARKLAAGAVKALAAAQGKVSKASAALEKVVAEQDAALVKAEEALKAAKTAAAALEKATGKKPRKAAKVEGEVAQPRAKKEPKV